MSSTFSWARWSRLASDVAEYRQIRECIDAPSLAVMAGSSRSTADLIVECLENEGVTHVSGIPGEENIRLVEVISRSSIRYVLTRHEQGASFMAETYARAQRRRAHPRPARQPAVSLGDAGPGR